MTPRPRSSTKAIIIADGKLLCNKCESSHGIYYMLPGGGQDKGETLHEALRRECIEEISARVEVGDLLFVRDYIAKNHWKGDVPDSFHQVEFMFECTLLDPTEVKMGEGQDALQIGVEWVPIDRLGEVKFYPAHLVSYFQAETMVRGVYLGDVN